MPNIPADSPVTVRHLWDHQKEVLRRVALGQTCIQIARELKITPATVSNIKNSALGQEHLGYLHAAADDRVIEVQERIKSLLMPAAEVAEEILLDKSISPNVRSRVAMDILDRGGIVAPTQHVHEHQHFDKSDIERFKQMAIESGQIVDVLPEEDPPMLEAQQ